MTHVCGSPDRFSGHNNDADIPGDLRDLQALVTSTGGLPLGITYDQFIKIIRKRKAVSWNTECEIAYQKLYTEIRLQQNPNKDTKFE